MNTPTPNPVSVPVNESESPPSRFQKLVYKSTLLNVVIVLTSFPVLVLAGGENAVIPALEIMAGITVLIWTTTFTLFSLVSIGRLLWPAFSSETGRKPLVAAKKVGVADRWLDGPV